MGTTLADSNIFMCPTGRLFHYSNSFIWCLLTSPECDIRMVVYHLCKRNANK